MMSARSRSDACATTSAALGPSPPMRMSSGPSSRNEKPRSASSSCIEDTPRSSTTPSTAAWPNFSRDAVERGEALLDQRQSAIGRLHQIGAVRHRALVAVDADDLRIGGREDRAAVAAGAEGAVDIDAAVADVEQLERGPREHGNVTGQSASDSRAIAARHHSRAPSGSSAALSKPGRFLQRAPSWWPPRGARRSGQAPRLKRRDRRDGCGQDPTVAA